MYDFFLAFLKTSKSQDVMEDADKCFDNPAFGDIKPGDLEQWYENVFKDVEILYPAGLTYDVRGNAASASEALGRWLKDRTDITAARDFCDAIDVMTTNMGKSDQGLANHPEQMDVVKDFKNRCYATMVTVALTVENAYQRRDAEDVNQTISTARLASTCDHYVGLYGDVPDGARISEHEKPSDYWKAKMTQVTGGGSKNKDRCNRILKNLQTLEADGKNPDIINAIVADIQKVDAANKDAEGLAAMVFAEAMRSDRVVDGGAYRRDQPDSNGSSRELTSDELKEMVATVRETKRKREEEAGKL